MPLYFLSGGYTMREKLGYAHRHTWSLCSRGSHGNPLKHLVHTKLDFKE